MGKLHEFPGMHSLDPNLCSLPITVNVVNLRKTDLLLISFSVS